jgi:hypothetical protein
MTPVKICFDPSPRATAELAAHSLDVWQAQQSQPTTPQGATAVKPTAKKLTDRLKASFGLWNMI